MRDAARARARRSVLFTTPLGMRIDEGLGGTPADISVRIFGPDLDELARLAEQARRDRCAACAASPTCARSSSPACRSCASPSTAQPAARVGLTPGDVIRAVRIGLVGEEVSEVWVGQRRFDLVVRLPDDRRDDVNAIRTLLIDGHDGTRIPLGQLADDRADVRPGRDPARGGQPAHRGRGDGRPAAILGGAAADVRERSQRELTAAAAILRRRRPGREPGARDAVAAASRSRVALLAVFLLLYLALGSVAEAVVILGDAARSRSSAASSRCSSPARPGTSRRWSA